MNTLQAELLWARFTDYCREAVILASGVDPEQFDPGEFLTAWAGAFKNGKVPLEEASSPQVGAQIPLPHEEEDEVPWSQVVPGLKCPARWNLWPNYQRAQFLATQVVPEVFEKMERDGQILRMQEAAKRLNCSSDLLYKMSSGRKGAHLSPTTARWMFVRLGFKVRIHVDGLDALGELVGEERNGAE